MKNKQREKAIDKKLELEGEKKSWEGKQKRKYIEKGTRKIVPPEIIITELRILDLMIKILYTQ